MNEPYSEARGKEYIDWNDMLDKIDRDGLTLQQTGGLFHKAFSWITCACGNLCDAIPRIEAQRGAPVDEKLNQLGVMFFDEIRLMKRDGFVFDNGYTINQFVIDFRMEQAKLILAQIEERANEILININYEG